MRKRIPADIRKKSGEGQLSWRDQDCKSFDCALARTCLLDAACQSSSLSGAENVWKFVKAVVNAYDTIQSSSPATPLSVASVTTKTVRLTRHNSPDHVSLNDFWKDLRDDDRILVRCIDVHFEVVCAVKCVVTDHSRLPDAYAWLYDCNGASGLQLRNWQQYTFTTASITKASRGLPDGTSRFDGEGTSMQMLRQVICQWFEEAIEQSAPCPVCNVYTAQVSGLAGTPSA